MNVDKIALNRRAVLKAAALALSTAPLKAIASSQAVADKPSTSLANKRQRVLPWRNWSGNQQCQPSERATPTDEDELKALVLAAKGNIRFVGAGHSFTALVPTSDTLITLAAMRGVHAVNPETGDADIWAGTRLAQLGEPLWQQGRALCIMPDIDTQALAGAIATSTHGTGAAFGSLSSQVTRIKLLDAQGQWYECDNSRDTDIFQAAKTHLGALGAVTRIRMQTRDKYFLQERTWIMPVEEALARASMLRDQHRHFEMYALPHGDYVMAIAIDEQVDSSVNNPDQAQSDSEQTFKIIANIIEWLPFLRSTLINAGSRNIEPSSRSDRSYKIFSNLRSIRFNEMEYAIPWYHGPQCLQEILETIKRKNIDVIFPIEYRYVKADDIWLSPFYLRDSCAISCHNFHDRDYKKYFAAIEPIFWKYEGRPHPAKIHTLSGKRLSSLYPKWNEFLRIREQLDPNGKFMNTYLKKIFEVHG